LAGSTRQSRLSPRPGPPLYRLALRRTAVPLLPCCAVPPSCACAQAPRDCPRLAFKTSQALTSPFSSSTELRCLARCPPSSLRAEHCERLPARTPPELTRRSQPPLLSAASRVLSAFFHHRRSRAEVPSLLSQAKPFSLMARRTLSHAAVYPFLSGEDSLHFPPPAGEPFLLRCCCCSSSVTGAELVRAECQKDVESCRRLSFSLR
jgi:hypothetical protein